MKQLPGLVSASSAPKTVMAASSVTCSLCPESFPGAKELGLHILAAHCGGGQDSTHVQSTKPVSGETENNTENIVVDANPGLFMDVDVVEKRPEAVVVKSTPTTISPRSQQQQQELPTLNLPRQPTAQEVQQKFMIYRLSDTSNRYICLVCDKMYTSRYNIRMHMNLHSGNNVHKCTYCGRHFAHKHVFESHVRTHTGERPFKCDECGACFAQS